jgi:metal-responsive CopG/Arc/MetJ family transcriptional regulator
MVKKPRPKKMEILAETKKQHTGVYLPPDLVRRLNQYQLDKNRGLRGRNDIIIQAIDSFLKKEKY